jgi:hypothetical protein
LLIKILLKKRVRSYQMCFIFSRRRRRRRRRLWGWRPGSF